ncbi:unnamed protein product [marine sediment metagenome]|uniref:Lipoyl-binding domain-containing protein n=1 Tax=marine sediment metagenome TaxID=412755 RepID=X1MEQ0_9ZZZZ
MRKFKIKVNGKVFEVEIEEETSAQAPISSKRSGIEVSVEKPPMPRAPRVTKKEIDITSPIPGLIIEIKKQVGDKVKAGETVIILEAMKMENAIITPAKGVVKEIKVKKGEKIDTGNLLMILTPSGRK